MHKKYLFTSLFPSSKMDISHSLHEISTLMLDPNILQHSLLKDTRANKNTQNSIKSGKETPFHLDISLKQQTLVLGSH